MPHRVFLDSNVLASRTVRDWILLCRLRTGDMFQLHTSLDVLAETIRVARRQHPRADGGVISEIDRKIRAVLDEIIEDFPGDVDFVGSDEHDQHVNAAATHARSDILVTDNVRDFGEAKLLPYDVYSADAFLCLVDDGNSAAVRGVIREQGSYWQACEREGRATKGLEEALRRAGCPDFADRVREHRCEPLGAQA
ncbi:hypothetical protein B7R54_17275 [Subtercola boreus]|uniref:PIN domain-containing protein n=1 Tax=Subtercola boreus TaxID=120213 RepID=A0A3E0VMS2_9MICO|nr:PIN domain-containing protein [Subtercola boreus]RFA10758.1 hypothetical protein B7R54_17275 [Subtercola boreus]TQL55669.1 PIN domain-containing protein [Subtercola boreus]